MKIETNPELNDLRMKPHISFNLPDEVPKGKYGLIVNGCSLVGKTELEFCSLLLRNFFLGLTLL